jgi:hypothetical protein
MVKKQLNSIMLTVDSMLYEIKKGFPRSLKDILSLTFNLFSYYATGHRARHSISQGSRS